MKMRIEVGSMVRIRTRRGQQHHMPGRVTAISKSYADVQPSGHFQSERFPLDVLTLWRKGEHARQEREAARKARK